MANEIRIKIEDYFGNDIAMFDLEVDELGLVKVVSENGINLADVDTDDVGEFLRMQLESEG